MFDVYMRTSGVEETGRASSIECTNTGFGMRGLEPGFTVWTPAELMNYMKNPRLAMGQNQMNFEGITDFQTRVDIIHYLKTLTWANPAFHEIVEKPHWFGPMRVYQGWKNDREGKKQKHRPVGIP
jgi:cytochrome c